MSSKMWAQWYEAQKKEQEYYKKVYPLVKPTLLPTSHFNPTFDAEVLRKAMKGLDTNEDDIIRILTRRTLRERMEIQDKYQQIYGRDLVKDLEWELSGIFKRVILSLLKPLPLFFAEQIKNTTEDSSLPEILVTRDYNTIQSIKEAFEMTYGYSFEEEICKKSEGNSRKMLMRIMTSRRDDFASTPKDVAAELTNEDIEEDDIMRIFTSYTFPFLKKVFKEYQDKTGKEFGAVIEDKYSELEDELVTIYQIAMDLPAGLAETMRVIFRCVEEKDERVWQIARIIVSRCEIDLGTIMEKYKEVHNSEMIEDLKEEFPNYAKALVNLMTNGGGSYDTGGNYNSEKKVENVKKVENDDSCAIL